MHLEKMSENGWKALLEGETIAPYVGQGRSLIISARTSRRTTRHTELCRISETRYNLAIFRGTGVSSTRRLWQMTSATSSAASALFIANSMARAISTRLPLIALSIAANRFLASRPILPLDVRSFSSSSEESDEYRDA